MPEDNRQEETRRLIQKLLAEGASLMVAGKLDEALGIGVEAMERARKVFGWKTSEFRRSINLVGSVYLESGNTMVARALYEWLNRTAEDASDEVRSLAAYRSNLGHCLLTAC